MTPETLASEWLTLFNTNCGKAITNKDFLSGYMDVDKKSKDLSEEDRKIFNLLIHKGVKEAMKSKQRKEMV